MAFFAIASWLIPIKAQLQFSTLESPVYYQVIFTYDKAAISDQGKDANLKTAVSDPNSDSQLWQLIGNEDNFTMRSKMGNYITFNGSRFATGTEATPLYIERYGSSYEVGRIGSDLHLSQSGGTGAGREINEYFSAYYSNILKFYAPDGLEARIEALEPPLIDVTLDTPGTLGVELLNKVDVLNDVERLKITGAFNDADWSTISNLNSIIELDMRGVATNAVPNEAFRGKTSLWSVKLPQNATYIGQYAFKQTAISGIMIPANVTLIGQCAFEEVTTLTEVEFEPNSQLQTISHSAFNYCKGLKRIHIPEGCVSIQNSVFSQCTNLVDVTLPSTLTEIGTYAFDNTRNLKELIFPEKLTRIGTYAFSTSGLTSIILPAGLSELGGYAFVNCTSATKIQLPSYIAQYKANFQSCNNVKEVICPAATPPAYNYTPFNGVNNLSGVTLTVPDFAVASYKLDTYWMQFGNIRGGAKVSLCNVAGALSLTNDRRIDGAPDVTILTNGSITLGGQAPQEFGLLTFEQNFRNASNYTFSQFINNCPLISARDLKNSIYLYANTWYFITPVGDIPRSQISHSDASAAFAIRRYSGQKRAENGSGGWTNLADDELLEAGKGYILQTNRDGWVTMDYELTNPSTLANIIHCGDVTMGLEDWPAEISANAGWNFLGNPYPSHFDTHFLDFPAPITVYDPVNRNYKAYSLADDNYVLRPMQPFFIQKPDGVDEVTFLKNGRQLSDTPNTSAYKAPRPLPSNRNIYNIYIIGNGLSDATRVVINPLASLSYEPNCDAAKMMSTEPDALQLWSIGDGSIPMAINERPIDKGLVAISAMLPSAGEYEISVDADGPNIAILDRQTSVSANSHKFRAAEAELVDDRYVLVINEDTSGLPETALPTAISISGNTVSAAVEIIIYAIDGRVVAHAKAGMSVIVPNGIYVAKGIDGTVAKINVNAESK